MTAQNNLGETATDFVASVLLAAVSEGNCWLSGNVR